MDQYVLQPDEVILFKGKAVLNDNNQYSEIVFTNLNLVATTRTKKLFSKEQIQEQTFPVEDIKVFNNTPQIKQTDSKIEIFFKNTELVLDFDENVSAKKFEEIAYELLTGKTAGQRKAERVRGALGYVDTALGINTIDTVTGIIGKKSSKTLLGGLAKATLGQLIQSTPDTVPTEAKQDKASALSLDEQIEMLKKLKDLLDSGIISQDEFDAKKAEIMNS